jgi:predicted transcriptional regulator
MQDQPTPKTVCEDDGDVDATVLDALLESGAQRPWSVDEIARVIGDPVAAADSLARLFRAGLIHRLDNFVFASRAALHADEVMLQNDHSG